MERIVELRNAIESALSEYAAISYAHGDVVRVPIIDRKSDNYLLMVVGWENTKRVHGCLVHLGIVEGKIWIQRDGTEEGMATELERFGVEKCEIVLGFHHPDLRQHTEYSIA
jgi:hypothetical protein